jgi:hypothetical protein
VGQRKVVWAAIAAVALVAPSSRAQSTSDPVLTAFSAYQAAKQRGDLAAAEVDATHALAASEARDGGGGATAILAFNLALLRLDLGRDADALGPARRALALANAGARGVDPLTLRLMIVEAALKVDPKADERDGLDALHEADLRGADIDAYAYPAAVALGAAALSSQHWSNAAIAWRSALNHAGPEADAAIPRSDDLVQEGIALVGGHKDREAVKAFDQALAILGPLAPEAREWGPVSPAEIRYAAALSWRAAVSSRLFQENHDLVEAVPGRPLLPGPRCAVAFSYSGALEYPTLPSSMSYGPGFGAGVVRFQVDRDGKITKVEALAAIPRPEFLDALSKPGIKWSLTRDKSSSPGCRMESNDILIAVHFTPWTG